MEAAEVRGEGGVRAIKGWGRKGKCHKQKLSIRISIGLSRGLSR